MLRTSKVLNRILWLLALLPTFGYAQNSLVNKAYQLDSMNMNRHAVSAQLYAGYGSNSFTPGSLTSVYFNGVVDDATLTDLAEMAVTSNKVFYSDNVHITYERPISKGMSLQIGLTQRNFASLVTPRTALEFAAFGNGPYKGSTIVFDNLGIDLFTASGLTLGFSRVFDLGNNKLKLNLNTSLLQGQNLVNVTIRNSSLFTEENAEYVDLVYDYEYNYNSTPQAFSGLGFDFGFRASYWHAKRFKIESWMEGLGKMYWNGSGLESGTAAGKINYEGLFFTFDELSTIGSNDELNTEVDSLKNLIAPEERDNYTLNLPYTLGLRLSTYLGKNKLISVGAHMVPGYYDLPVLNVGFRHFATSQIYSGINYNTGPFGGHAVGLEFGYAHDKFSFEVKANSPFRLSEVRTPLTGCRIKLSYFI